MQAIPIPVSTHAPLPPRVAPAHQRIVLARPGHEWYDAAVDLGVTKYREHFGCPLRHRYPAYLCLLRHGRLLGACGLRPGTANLYLQQYLDKPVARLLSEKLGTVVDAEALVELGSFAVRKRGVALPFMAALAPALGGLGFTHAVATATLPVRRCLRRLEIQTKHLGPADAARLREGDQDWGSYYSQRPAVIAGPIAQAQFRLLDVLAG